MLILILLHKQLHGIEPTTIEANKNKMILKLPLQTKEIMTIMEEIRVIGMLNKIITLTMDRWILLVLRPDMEVKIQINLTILGWIIREIKWAKKIELCRKWKDIVINPLTKIRCLVESTLKIFPSLKMLIMKIELTLNTVISFKSLLDLWKI